MKRVDDADDERRQQSGGAVLRVTSYRRGILHARVRASVGRKGARVRANEKRGSERANDKGAERVEERNSRRIDR